MHDTTPGRSFCLAVALAGLSIWYTSQHFALNTDISKLISPDLDWRQREIAFEKAFPGSHESIVAVVEAPTAELTKLATSDLQQRLRSRTDKLLEVGRNIAGSPFFQQNGLLFLSTEEVKDTAEKLAKSEPLIGSLATDPSLRGMTEALTTVLAGLKRGEVKIDDLAKPFNKFSDTIDNVLSKGTATFSWRELVNGGPLPESDLQRLPPDPADARLQGARARPSGRERDPRRPSATSSSPKNIRRASA